MRVFTPSDVTLRRGSPATSRSSPLDVYLLQFEESRVFYAEAPESIADSSEAEPAPGAWGWLQRRYRKLRDAILSSRGVGSRIQRLWGWLQRRIAPDEPMLRRLRSDMPIAVHHPTTMASREARAYWRRYLANRRPHHLGRLILNLMIAPVVGLLLMPIPGPNVLGFWFFYRSICHGQALRGVMRALDRRTPTIFHPNSALDGTLHDGEVATVAARFAWTGLDDYVQRSR